MIIVLPPGCDLFSCIFERHKPVCVEALVPETSAEGYDEGVIGRFSRARGSSVTPFSYAHLPSARQMNSGPVVCLYSDWMQPPMAANF